MQRESAAAGQPARRTEPGRGTLLVNLLLYQIGWFACVLGAASQWAGWALALGLVAVHLALVSDRRRELRLLAASVAIGLGVEALLLGGGALRYPGGPATLGLLPPVWIVVLWLQFATLLHFALRWLSGRYLLAALLGAVGGPPTYLTGQALGAVALGPDLPAVITFLLIGSVWAVALPALVFLADRWQPRRSVYSLRASPA